MLQAAQKMQQCQIFATIKITFRAIRLSLKYFDLISKRYYFENQI